VVNIDEIDKKLELEYPCNWCYKIIGKDRDKLHDTISKLLLERDHNIEHSNSSSSGKYICLNLDLLVHSDDDREALYEALRDNEHITRVL